MNEALAHLNQLIKQGCEYPQAQYDTTVAFKVNADDLQVAYDEQF